MWLTGKVGTQKPTLNRKWDVACLNIYIHNVLWNFFRLTSWVIRIFKHASFQDWENLFYIEPQIFTRSVEWILKFQTDTGSFTETAWYYSPLDTKMWGKVYGAFLHSIIFVI